MLDINILFPSQRLDYHCYCANDTITVHTVHTINAVHTVNTVHTANIENTANINVIVNTTDMSISTYHSMY